MKKLLATIFVLGLTLVPVSLANAQMMGRFSNLATDWNEVVEHTFREEKAGKELWDKFQAKEVVCADFTDEQFGVLGEYFMGQMLGDSHAAMNAMIMQMHGKEGEEQIHIVMGRRLSGCDTSAITPGWNGGWLAMMNMMNFNFTPFGGFGRVFIILWWALIIAGLAALIKWIVGQFRGGTHGNEKSSLAILKDRYARGEIDKKEFIEKKKDLS